VLLIPWGADGWNETVAAGTGWRPRHTTTEVCVTSKQLAKIPVKHPDREAGADGADGCAVASRCDNDDEIINRVS